MKWLRGVWKRVVRWAAWRWNRSVYLAGYGEGYDQGHFDGFADYAMRDDPEGPDENGVWVSGFTFDADDEIPF